MTDFPTGSAGLVNAQQMMLTFLGVSSPSPQTGEGGIINVQVLLQQILSGGGVGGGMNPPGTTGIGAFTTNGTNGPATYNPTTGALNVPNYSTIPVLSGGITSLTTTGASGPSTYSPSTGILNIPVYASSVWNSQGYINVVATQTSTSTVYPGLSTGLGFPLTANVNPCVRISYIFLVSYAVASTVPSIAIFRTTGAIPAQGTAPGGTDVAICLTRNLCLINTNNNLTGYFLDTTLTVGVPYNYYATFWCSNAGPATIQVATNTGLIGFEVK